MDAIAILMKCGWSREEAIKRTSQGFKGIPVGKSLADLNEERYGDGKKDGNIFEEACKDADRLASSFIHTDFGAKEGCEWEAHNVIGG